jgi:Nuclease-related domain
MAMYLRPAALNYARRQQYGRLRHAGKTALGSAAGAVPGLVAASAGMALLAGLLLLMAAALGLCARHWLSLARRSRVGARSEEEVQRALAPLEAEGWRLRHSLPWQGQGDIDSVAIAPNGVGIVIETKTSTYDERHLARAHEQAVWLSRRRRRWCRDGALAILCVVGARGVQRREHDVLVVSIDRLAPMLKIAAGTVPLVVDSSRSRGFARAVEAKNRRANA